MKTIWTSMVEVSGSKNNLVLHGHKAAYVWVAAEASDIDEYKQSIEEAFRNLDLTLVSILEVRTAEEAEATEICSEELLALILKVRNHRSDIAYGGFYRFTHGDADRNQADPGIQALLHSQLFATPKSLNISSNGVERRKSKMIVSYRPVEEFPGWEKPSEFFKSLLSEHGSKRILEVGSGANPSLTPEYVRESGLTYITSDVDAEELQKANPAFERLVVDLSVKDIDPALTGSFDCVLSRMVGEHISDGYQYHANIHKMLRPGGISAHCFSTLWSLPFMANRFLPESLGERLLHTFAPRDRHQHGKFKAYYSWSRGPSKSMVQRFENLGFEIIRYTGYFGHNYYRKSLPLLQPLETLKSKLLLKHPVPQLCSYAVLILRKPEHRTTQDQS